MVNNKIAQRAVAAGLSGLMAFGAAAPAALAYTNYGNFRLVSTKSSDDSAHWKRLAGDNRYGTMKEIVKAYNELNENLWTSLRKGYSNREVYTYHSTVVLASGDNWPDALAANGLAGYLTNVGLNQSVGSNESVPVLITKSNALSTETKDLLKGMQVQNCIIMGGTAAVSQDVEDAINKMGIGTQRVAGKDRQDTSIKAMQRINGNWDKLDKTYDLIIASGNNYADALSISPYAYRMGTPIILTDKDGKLTEDEVAAIRANDKIKEIVIVGGTSAVKDDVLGQIGTIKNNRTGINVVRVAGVDRYETSAKIAEFEIADWSRYARLGSFSFDHAIVATGENFPDALVGGQLAGGLGATIDVDGFTVEDLNAWTPCPLLLTKDGDTRADNMIAQGISGRWYNNAIVTSGTSTYASLGSWLNTWTTWYGADDTTNDEWQALFKTWYLEGWAGGFWISDAAIDGSTTNDVQLVPGVEGYANYSFTVELDSAGNRVVTGLTVTGEGAVAGPTTITPTYNPGKFDPDTEKYITPGYLRFSYDDAIHNTRHNATIEVTSKSVNDKLVDIFNGVDESYTFSNQAGTFTVRSGIENRNTIGSYRSEIIAYCENDNDFYGIILGGTKAVSNDKRDDLEKVVNNLAKRNDVFTVGSDDAGTISVVGADGVRRNYNRLVKVKDDANYVGTVTAYKGYTADVFGIAGTSSHAVCVFDKDGDFVNWLYYYGSNNTELKADWNV